ncbi:MAG: ATP-binding protein [Luteolibacter sp.]
MPPLLHSVRWRLQIWHALILMVVIALLCILAHRLITYDKKERIDQELATYERGFVRHVWELANRNKGERRPPSPDRLRDTLQNLEDIPDLPLEMRNLFDPSATGSIYLAIWDGSGKVIFVSENAPRDLSLPGRPPSDQDHYLRMRQNYREQIHNGPRGMLSVTGRDISSDRTALRNLAWQISLSGTALWLLGLVGGWWLAGRVIQPIDAISQTATRIAEGAVSERIDVAKTDDELSRLSRILNDTFDRLEGAIKRQQQFTADASHELRTPITVILSETSRGLKRERPADEYREILTTCAHAATRMRTLVESLLVLANQDRDTSAHPLSSCDLKTLTLDAISLLQPLANERNTTISHKLSEVTCQGNSRELSMVILNLLSNAIDHQPAGGSVYLTLRSENHQALLEVRDRGPGIPEEHQPHVFDRFYRVDPSRHSHGDHSGLGLAIVKAIVTHHGGTITLESTPQTGTCFRVALPLS